MKRASKKIPWSKIADKAKIAYDHARAKAQALANADGFDRGIEVDEMFREWHVFMLPNRENRRGFEVRCEVVSCEDLSKRQPGHGPTGLRS